MQHTDNDKGLFKAEILAELIYKAIVRYTKARKLVKERERSNFRLDSERILRGNVTENLTYWRDEHE